MGDVDEPKVPSTAEWRTAKLVWWIANFITIITTIAFLLFFIGGLIVAAIALFIAPIGNGVILIAMMFAIHAIIGILLLTSTNLISYTNGAWLVRGFSIAYAIWLPIHFIIVAVFTIYNWVTSFTDCGNIVCPSALRNVYIIFWFVDLIGGLVLGIVMAVALFIYITWAQTLTDGLIAFGKKQKSGGAAARLVAGLFPMGESISAVFGERPPPMGVNGERRKGK
ncbi:MAG: hypothetical protein ACTSUE_10590 [Promethearchaeota archaeon]